MFVVMLGMMFVFGLPLAAVRTLLNRAQTAEAIRERKVGKVILGTYAVSAILLALLQL